VYATVIKLDALTDTVGATAQHHDLFAIGGGRLALLLIGRVHIGGAGGKLGGTGVHPLEHGSHPGAPAQFSNLTLTATGKLRQALIGESLAFEKAQAIRIQRLYPGLPNLRLDLNQLLYLHQEPGIDLGDIEHLLPAHPGAEGIGQIPDALGTRLPEFMPQGGGQLIGLQIDDLIQTTLPGFQPAQGLLKRFLKGTADGHHLAHRFHLGGETIGRLGKLLEGEAGDLGHYVVDGRLERGRGGAAGDLVAQLIQGETHRQFGGHLGDGKPGGLGGQGRGAGDPGIHLDDDHAPVIRIYRELDVGPAGIDADLAQHRQRGVAHDLVLFVGQGLGRSDGNGITGMHPHGIQVFDGADNDAIVLVVTHHLHLVLFPAQGRLFDQQFVGRREVQAAPADLDKLLLVVGNTTTRPPHGKRGSDNGRKANLDLDLQRLLQAVRHGGAGHIQADLLHRLAEQVAILGLVDRLPGSPDHLHTIRFEYPFPHQIQRTVEGGLPPHGRQQHIRTTRITRYPSSRSALQAWAPE